MLVSWHDATLDQKHLFTLLMNQLYVTHVLGLQGWSERRGKNGVKICRKFGLPTAAWPLVITYAPGSLIDDSDTACQSV